eukprot:363637-Chlamydomonas_euryale.AAC.10
MLMDMLIMPALVCNANRCLQKYSFSQKMCTRELDDLVRCCRTLKKPDASLHCAGFMHQINETQDETGQEAQFVSRHVQKLAMLHNVYCTTCPRPNQLGNRQDAFHTYVPPTHGGLMPPFALATAQASVSAASQTSRSPSCDKPSSI